MKHIVFGKPPIGREEINFVTKVIKSKWMGSGQITQDFENKFRKFKNSKYAISTNSCTSALYLALKYSGVKPGDEVITTPMTFVSTINSIIHVGAKPILADVDPLSFNIDPFEIKKKITKKTKALLIVHLAGLPCEMNEILKIVKKKKLILIEDCAHAIESKYQNKHLGNFGDAGCFSFYSTKNITTGEGGMLICNKKNIYEKSKIARLHGLSRDAWKRYLPNNVRNKKKFEHYDVEEVGHKFNMIDLNASIGIAQLKKIEKHWRERKKLFEIYEKELKNLPILFQEYREKKKSIKHAYHLFFIVINRKKTKKKRDQLLNYLQKNSIGCGIHYRCVTDFKIFKKIFRWNKSTCKKAKFIGDNTISLPLYPGISNKEIKFICEKVKNFF